MIDLTITVDEAKLRAIIAGLEALAGDPLRREIADAVGKQGVLAEGRNTPPQSGKRQAFVSPAQRRALFAKLRAGAIQVPYQRTGRLVAGWRQADPFTVINETPYADLVVGAKGKQSAYHAGNWKREDEIAETVEAGPAAFIAAGVVSEFVATRF